MFEDKNEYKKYNLEIISLSPGTPDYECQNECLNSVTKNNAELNVFK